MISKAKTFGALVAVAFGAVACSAAAPEGPAPDESVTEAEGEARIFCGGIAGIPCPTGYNCVDDPHDSCDPNNGGADCGGVCRRQGKPKCSYNDPTKSYISKDPNQCMVMKFMCAEGSAPFFDDCGCGCQTTSGGEACGSNTCGAGEYCCNASCGICAPEGGVCIQIACEPI